MTTLTRVAPQRGGLAAAAGAGKGVLAATLLAAVTGAASAATVTFVPPNDTVGEAGNINENDGYADGRGIGFTVSSEVSLFSVGTLQDLTDITLGFGVYEISRSGFSFTRDTTLASGNSMVSTQGLEWIDFPLVGPLTLTPGTDYLIEFTHSGNANAHLFYRNAGEPWSQPPFEDLDGVQASSFLNLVVPAVRVGTEPAAVIPLPGALVLLASAIGGLALIRRRRPVA